MTPPNDASLPPSLQRFQVLSQPETATPGPSSAAEDDQSSGGRDERLVPRGDLEEDHGMSETLESLWSQ